MSQSQTLIRWLKVIMLLGLVLFLTGHYMMSYTNIPEDYGVKGLVGCAALMAVGIVLSLPTKMYLTFIWVTSENRKNSQLTKAHQEYEQSKLRDSNSDERRASGKSQM